VTKQTPPLIVALKRIARCNPGYYNVEPQDWPEGADFCKRYEYEYWHMDINGYYLMPYGEGVLDGWELAQCD
jgi:hypothetical protein